MAAKNGSAKEEEFRGEVDSKKTTRPGLKKKGRKDR